MAKWPVMIDEFKFEVTSHGGRTGIQMRILKDLVPPEAGEGRQRPARGLKRATRAAGRGARK
jgi:hypothetical protein